MTNLFCNERHRTDSTSFLEELQSNAGNIQTDHDERPWEAGGGGVGATALSAGGGTGVHQVGKAGAGEPRQHGDVEA